jgi:hypothetical protein
MAVRLSALRTRRTLLPRNIIISMFLVLIYVTGLVRPEGLGKFKNLPHQESNPRPIVVKVFTVPQNESCEELKTPEILTSRHATNIYGL